MLIVVFFLGIAEGVPMGECELFRAWHCEITTGEAAATRKGEQAVCMIF